MSSSCRRSHETVENVDRDGGLGVPHAAGVVARVGLGGVRDVQPRHRPVPQQVRLHADSAIKDFSERVPIFCLRIRGTARWN